jgi:uncharacterized protein (DUF2147 family)
VIRANLVKILVAVALSLGGASAARAQAAGGVTGWWLDAEGKGGILITPCGQGQLCGTVAWLKHPLNDAGKPKTDIHNPVAALQARPLCGLALLGGFSPEGSGYWDGGWIYDPESGNTYHAHFTLEADGTLHLRGYIGVPLLGRTSVWTRPATPLKPCT